MPHNTKLLDHPCRMSGWPPEAPLEIERISEKDQHNDNRERDREW